MQRRFVRLAAVLVCAAAIVCAAVRTDFDRKANFGRYRTYSWIEVKSENPLWIDRICTSVDAQLAARGWTKMAKGGDAVVSATAWTDVRERLYTYYSGDPGWGWGWQSGSAYTQVIPEEVGNLIVDITDGSTRKLIWRGTGNKVVSSKSGKNIRRLNDMVEDMFKHFPTGKS